MAAASWIISAFESPSGAIAGKVAIMPILPDFVKFSRSAIGFESFD
jgi:hypothetical protein